MGYVNSPEGIYNRYNAYRNAYSIHFLYSMVIRCIDLQNSHSFAGILPCQGGRIFNRSSDRVGRRKCMLCWEMSGLKKNATPRKVTKGQKNKPLKNCTAVKLSQTLAELSLNRSYKVSAKECQSWWIQKGLGPCTSIHSRKSIPILLKSIWMTPATEEMMREDFGWSVKRIVGIFLVELECRDGRTEWLSRYDLALA